MSKLTEAREISTDVSPSEPIRQITSAEDLDSALTLANYGDSEVNRHLLNQLIAELSDGKVSPALGCWFAAKLRPVLDGHDQFDRAFHIRKKAGRQKGTVGHPDEFIALGVSILQVTNPGISWSSIYETLAATLHRSPERIKDVVDRCRKDRILHGAKCI